MIFSSGISTGTIVALILNKILKEEKEDCSINLEESNEVEENEKIRA